jgi:hypothetical protein
MLKFDIWHQNVAPIPNPGDLGGQAAAIRVGDDNW